MAPESLIWQQPDVRVTRVRNSVHLPYSRRKDNGGGEGGERLEFKDGE